MSHTFRAIPETVLRKRLHEFTKDDVAPLYTWSVCRHELRHNPKKYVLTSPVLPGYSAEGVMRRQAKALYKCRRAKCVRQDVRKVLQISE